MRWIALLLLFSGCAASKVKVAAEHRDLFCTTRIFVEVRGR
jgi:hypothetical protein